MPKKKTLTAAFILLVAVTAILVIYSILTLMPYNPLEGCEQLVLVVSRIETAHKARLLTYDRDGDSWRFKFSCPAVIGENGMAWGRGLHRDRARGADEPVKVEGDGTSPRGAFELLQAYGYQRQEVERIKFPYMQITPDMICIDEARSEYYNMILRSGEKGLDPENLPSHEDMLREDDLYKYAILIGHNTGNTVNGAGSCIFLHIWESEDSHTAGCTAISDVNILRLLALLDPAKNPCIVQLTRLSYLRLREEWGLPDMTL